MGKKERNSGTGKGDKTETPLRLQGQQRGRENTRQREVERAREGEGGLMGWGNMGKHARQGRHRMNTRRGTMTTEKENKTQGHT